MKKNLIAILIITLVTFSLFADTTLPDAATFTLSTTIIGSIKHGFFAGKASTISDPTNVATSASNTTINPYDTNDLGYYNLYTNLASQVKVTFAIESLKATFGSTTWYVPYTLNFVLAETDGTRFPSSGFTLTTTTLGSNGTAAAGTDPLTNKSGVLFTTAGVGNGYISVALSAVFNSANKLTEGTYTGTITASVSAP